MTAPASERCDVFRRAVEKELAFLKETASIADLHARGIVLAGGAGLLVPVCALHADDDATLALVGAAAAREDLDAPERIAFLVLDRHGHAAGHVRVAADLDRRRVDVEELRSDEPELRRRALDALCEWLEDMFAPDELCVAGEPAAPRPPADGPILTAGPMIGPREASYGLDAVRNGWNHEHSRYTTRLERELADYVGCRFALATSSCTGALHLALLALGIGPGDEVIVPELTWVATASAVAYTGATPVFADVEPESWCLDAAAAEALVGVRTRAIVPVHLYGHPADMDAVLELAARHDLRVVEDAAPAIGAEVRGRRVGALGDAGAFSFQGAKLVVAGEGGMLCTDDEELYERARLFWQHGCSEPDRFWVTELGVKYRMANVQAAVALGQLERVDELVEAKRRIFGWYEEELGDDARLTLNAEAPWARSIYWMPSVLLADDVDADREQLRRRLKDVHGVDTRAVFPAISRYPIWRRRQEPGPVADRIGRRALNLPSGVRLRREHVARVAAALRAELDR